MVLSALETGTVQVYGIEDAMPASSFAARWRLAVSTWSPDGERIASLAHNRDKALNRAGTEHEPTAVVYLWDPSTGEAGPELVSQDDDIGAPVFSPDGGLVWCGDEHGRAVAWDVLTGARVRSFGEGAGEPAFAIDVSPDGTLVALGDQGGELRVFSAADGEELLREKVDTVGVQGVRFAPDGATVVAATGLTLHAIAVDTGEEHPVLLRHGGPVKAAAWSPDGALVATGGTDRSVRLWDPVTGEHLRLLEGHLGFVYAVRFSPDGRLLASAGQDGTVRFWDIETGAPEAVLIEGELAVTDLDFSPDGTALLAAVADRTLRIIDVETGEESVGVGGLPGITFQARYLGSGAQIASASRDVRVFDAASFSELRRIEGFDGSVTGFAASPDGRLLAGGLVTKEVLLWDEDGETLHRLLGHPGRITAAAFAADGVLLATASETESGARLWNAPEGRALGVLEGHRAPVLCLAFDPDGARLLTGSEDGTALVWSTRTR
jgi:WD40 repeat protein